MVGSDFILFISCCVGGLFVILPLGFFGFSFLIICSLFWVCRPFSWFVLYFKSVGGAHGSFYSIRSWRESASIQISASFFAVTLV